LGEHLGEHMLAGFDKARVGFDRPRRFPGPVALAEIQAQALDDLMEEALTEIRRRYQMGLP